MRDDQEIINDDKCKTEELENIAMILSGISDNMFSAPSVSVSNKGTYFLSGESIIASENTIKSIDFCCQRGYFADAFTLARKYRDDVIQYIFLTQIIDNMSRISDEEVKEYCGKDLSVGNLLQVIEKSLNILRDGTNKTDIEIAVELWIYGSLEEEKHFTERKKFFDTAKYIGKLTEDTLIKELMEKYLKDIWKKTDRTLNNYVHGNGYHYIVDNYSSYNYRERKASVYKGYKRDEIEMRGDRAEMSDFPLYLNTVAGGLDCRNQAIGGFSFVVKIYALPVVEIIGQFLYLLGRYGFDAQIGYCF